MPTTRELSLKVKADGGELRVLSSQVKNLGDDAERASSRSRRGFDQVGGALGRLTTRAVKAGAAITAIGTVTVVALLTKELIESGNAAEVAELRIGTVFQTTEEEAKRVFGAIREFAAPLPVTTQSIVDAFIGLGAVNLDPTVDTLKTVTNAALATGESVDTIVEILKSTETEPLRRLGIELDRTGDKAVIAFKDTRLEVGKTDREIREGLLELFETSFPDGIERAQGTFSVAVATMQSVVGDLTTEASEKLLPTITSIITETSEWIDENEDLLQLKLDEAAVLIAGGFKLAQTSVSGMTEAVRIFVPEGDLLLTFFEIGVRATQGFILGIIGVTKVLRTLVEANILVQRAGRATLEVFDRLPGVDNADEIREVTSSIRENRSFVDSLNDSISRNEQTLESLITTQINVREQVANLKTEYEGLSRSTDEQTDSVGILDDFVKRNSINTNEASKANEENAESIEKTGEAAGKATEELRKLNPEIREAIESVPDRLREKFNQILDDLNRFESIEFDLLPETEKIRQRADEQLAFLDEFDRKYEVSTERLQNVREGIISESEQRITEILSRENVERLREQEGFNNSLIAGYAEFVDQVQNNSDLTTQFFSDTLREIDNNFSDLVYNTLKGDFDSLEDIAENTFDAILRSFIDLTVAIGTRELVINIGANTLGGAGGIPGVDTGGFGLPGIGSLFGGGGGSLGAGIAVPGGPQIPGAGGGSFLGGIFSGGGFPTTGLGQAAFFGAPFAGALLGGLQGGTSGAISGGIGGLGGSLGFLAGGPVGAALGGLGGSLLGNVLGGLFEKDPRLDIDFKEELEGRAVVVEDFLEGFDRLFEINTNRKLDADEAELRRLFEEQINGTINSVLTILDRLPQGLSDSLSEQFLETQVLFTETVDDKLTEFDESGSTALERLQKGIESGEIGIDIVASSSKFFEQLLVSIGAEAGRAFEFVQEDFFDRFIEIEDRAERGQFGKEFLASIDAYVTAFVAAEGEFQDAQGQAVNALLSTSRRLGFEVVPNLEQIQQRIQQGIETLEVDPSTIQNLVALRNSIIELNISVADSVLNITQTIERLNSEIVSLGGSRLDTTGSIRAAISSTQDLLDSGGLSLSEREALLGNLDSLTSQLESSLLAVAQSGAESLRQANEQRINSLREERTLIQDSGRRRIEALREELQLANSFASLATRISDDIDNLATGDLSIFTPVEQLGILDARINNLDRQLQTEDDPEERLRLIDGLREGLLDVLGTTAEAFGEGSPEFISSFERVSRELEELKAVTESSTRPVEEINADILSVEERTEQRISSIDSRISSLNSQTNTQIGLSGQNLAEIRALKEEVRSGLVDVLGEKEDRLADITVSGNEALLTVESQQLNELAGIRQQLAGIRTESSGPRTQGASDGGFPFTVQGGQIIPAAKGFEGMVSSPTFFLAGEAGPENVSIRPLNRTSNRVKTTRDGDVNIDLSGLQLILPNITSADDPEFSVKIERAMKDLLKGRLGKMIKKEVEGSLDA